MPTNLRRSFVRRRGEGDQARREHVIASFGFSVSRFLCRALGESEWIMFMDRNPYLPEKPVTPSERAALWNAEKNTVREWFRAQDCDSEWPEFEANALASIEGNDAD